MGALDRFWPLNRQIRRRFVDVSECLFNNHGIMKIYKLMYCQQLENLLKKYDIDMVLDVGANAGQYYRFLRNQVGYRGLILSFEPIAELARTLRGNATQDPSWRIFDVALGAQDGIAEFNVTRESVFSSFRLPCQDHIVDKGNVIDHVEQVQVRRLDSILDQFDRHHNGDIFLKLDTQGYDLEVIKGISSFERIRLIQSEVSLVPIYKDMPSIADSLTMFRDFGFSVAALCAVNMDNEDRVVEFDCLMVRPKNAAPSHIV